MSFRITISEMSNTLEKCVESVVCRVDTPNDSNARSSEVGNIIQILGRTGTEEPICLLLKADTKVKYIGRKVGIME